MLSFNPNNNTERENYKLLIGTVIPRPIAFVTSTTTDGTVNGAPFSYFNIVSSSPPMISVSVQRKDGKRKDTARNIKHNKEFVVHIVDEENVEKINETAASLPPDVSEIEQTGLTLTESSIISVPGINEAKVRFECKLEQAIELGQSTDLLIGKIVQYHIAEEIYEEGGYINYGKLNAMSRLAGHDYASIGEITTIKRPK